MKRLGWAVCSLLIFACRQPVFPGKAPVGISVSQLKMNEMDVSTFDKLLLEAVFQSEQDSQKKENAKEYIQRCTAKLLQEKQRIFELRKDISLCDETILDLQKYNTENNESITRFTSLCTVLNREEALLHSQLENIKNQSENDRYQLHLSYKMKEVVHLKLIFQY
ncbi:protein SIX6OS1 [Lithobates pipiens]